MEKSLNILFAGEQPSDVDLIHRELKRSGFAVGIKRVERAQDFQSALQQGGWDVIISDYQLSDFNAFNALELLAGKALGLPFIVFSDSIGEEAVVSVLKAGAHDYILREHAARLVPAIERELSNAESRRARLRAEKVRNALLKFSQATQASLPLEKLLGIVHTMIAELMPAGNIYIALYDDGTDTISFPYYVDEYDEPPPPTKPGRGLTEYILRSGKSVLASPELFEELVSNNEVELIGSPSIDWMGVPLKIGDQVFGVLAIQSYTEGIRYQIEDMDILTFASDQIALAINRMRADQELKEEVAFRKTIEVSVNAGIFGIDLDGKQTYVNPAFCRMLGWSDVELLGAHPPFKYWPDEEIESIREAFRITTGENALPSDFELRFKRKNGERFDAYLLVSPLHDSNNFVIGWLASVYDITERKNAEEAIQRQTKRAEDLAHMAEKLNARLDLQKVLDTICVETAKALNVPAAAVILYDRESDSYSLGASVGFSSESMSEFRIMPISPLGSVNEFSSSSSVIIPDLRDTPNLPDGLRLANARSLAVVNMLRDSNNIGNLAVFSINSERDFTDDELTLLHGMANLGEQAIVNARLFEETERRLEQVHALHAIDLAISASLDITVTLNILLDHVISLLNIDSADILLYNSYSQQLEYAVGRGFRNLMPAVTRLRTGGGFASQAVMDRRLIHIEDLSRITSDSSAPTPLRDEGFVTYLACPLIAKGIVKGVLEIYHRSSLKINSERQELLEALAGQAAIAIDNASLFTQLQRSNEELMIAYDSTLEGWVRAIDLRDKESETHTRQVTELTLRIARMMGIHDEELIHLRRGALLHDVGKIGISDQILRKPGALSNDEWEIVKQHPIYAYQILYPITYLQPALNIPYCHHEKWDGSGYPRGLSGEDIPLSARIFAVVDVWSSLRIETPYRAAWTDERAIQYIKDQAGKHFDPQVVEVFLRAL